MLLQTHLLLIASLKLKLKRSCTGDSCQCLGYDTTRLFNDTTKQQQFKIALLKNFRALDELLEEKTINEKWQTISESFTSTCKDVLGPKNNTTKSGSQLRPLKRSRGEKEERQKSTTVECEQEKPGPMKNILMQAR